MFGSSWGCNRTGTIGKVLNIQCLFYIIDWYYTCIINKSFMSNQMKFGIMRRYMFFYREKNRFASSGDENIV